MNQFLQFLNLLVALLPLVPLPLIYLICSRVEQRVLALVPAHERNLAASVVRTAVMGVEQTCSQMDGPAKKSEALRIASSLLSESGLKVSPNAMDALIEQAVFMLSQGQDPQATSMALPVAPSVSK